MVLIARKLKTNDSEGLERAYRVYNGAFPEVLYPNAEGVQTLLDDIAPRTPKAATADPKTFWRYEFGSGTRGVGVYKAGIQKERHKLNSECPLFRVSAIKIHETERRAERGGLGGM